jgi:hydrogenase maturation protease
MKKLVLCFGSPLRNDDSAALHVAQRLSEIELDKDVEILALHQITPELATDIAQCDLLIFLDSSPFIQKTVSSEIYLGESGEESESLSHSYSVESLLAMGKRLYGSNPRTILVQIPGSDYEIGTELSEHTQNQIDNAVVEVLQYLRN